ncbi:hypothetical protein [Thalassotalea agarivorans]|uniref:KfrA N-terminal DNA-binding domain-containing protein n=1 Tax=Thalassotalea agarivorans TaxID=349064 RepID=A0A1I0FH72_THASX|nr:hypothetical protein [Thalassotalea agarivorans]SET56882.1 hypothetical protein SAMN05660429_02110 [Thalassotalea agarivorans]
MTSINDIHQIANKLKNEGKQPTTALVKSRVTGNVPLPTIIQAMKSWQHEPDNIATNAPVAEKQTVEEASTGSDSDILSQILNRLTAIEDRISRMEAQLKK